MATPFAFAPSGATLRRLTILAILVCIAWLAIQVAPVVAQIDTGLPFPNEVYPTCTAAQAAAIACGANANCIVLPNGQPGCACIVDVVTGLALTGDPYNHCTYDVSGVWQLFTYNDKLSKFTKPILSPLSNEPFIVRFDRTEGILVTQYITGAIFSVTALTSFAVGICSRLLLDIYDRNTVIMENSEGYVGQRGMGMILRTPRLDTSLMKRKNNAIVPMRDLSGQWVKEDGSTVNVKYMKPPKDMVGRYTDAAKAYSAYSFADSAFAGSGVDRVMGIWLDRVKKVDGANAPEGAHDAQFVQTGWLGTLRFGSRRIDIYDVANNGKPVLTLYQLDSNVLPPLAPVPSTASSIGTSTQDLQANSLQNGSRRSNSNPSSSSSGDMGSQPLVLPGPSAEAAGGVAQGVQLTANGKKEKAMQMGPKASGGKRLLHN